MGTVIWTFCSEIFLSMLIGHRVEDEFYKTDTCTEHSIRSVWFLTCVPRKPCVPQYGGELLFGVHSFFPWSTVGKSNIYTNL